MVDFSEEIVGIEKQIRETPYHKATEHHIGRLRARLAKLKDRQLEAVSKTKGGGAAGYSIKKQGDATVVLVGPPSSGKSTLINRLTNAESKVAPYAFTTVSVIPGMLKYKDAYIQILDVPGLIEGASKGKGRGREVLSVARGADLLILMTDVDRQELLGILQEELYESGVRINENKPDVIITKKSQGGLQIQTNLKQDITKETIKEIAAQYGFKNADIVIREKLTFNRAIDAFSQNRVFIPVIYAVNKTDLKKKPAFKHQASSINISALKGVGLEELKQTIWEKLGLVRVFLVRPDEEPSEKHPIIMKKGQTLLDTVEKIGEEFAEGKRLAKIWGSYALFPGQEVALTAPVQEGLQVRFI